MLNFGIKSFIETNRQEAFKYFVEVIKKQNKELVKKFIGFNSFDEYKKSELYPKKAEQVNGFYFVAID